MNTSTRFDRVIWIVLDGVGAGPTWDTSKFGDTGAHTLENLGRRFHEKKGRPLSLPNLQRLGIGNLGNLPGVSPLQPGDGLGFFGVAQELSQGKDTTSGHWEMVGYPVVTAFKTFPNGFSSEFLEPWIRENSLPGVLGNCVASGTEIIEQFGEAHIRTGKPIVYTSADSVFQIAAHEAHFGLERLYAISKSARKLCDREQISRVIARPFVDSTKPGTKFTRTYNRKDYALEPAQRFLLEDLVEMGVSTLGIGKIASIFAYKGIQQNIDTAGNTDGIRVLLESLKKVKKGLIFCNLIDFDMLYGHRRDVEGFGIALEEWDLALGNLLTQLGPKDLLLMTADHGNDPTHVGTDHTREMVPILGFSSMQSHGAKPVGVRSCFADMGQTVAEALLGDQWLSQFNGKSKYPGVSFLNLIN